MHPRESCAKTRSHTAAPGQQAMRIACCEAGIPTEVLCVKLRQPPSDGTVTRKRWSAALRKPGCRAGFLPSVGAERADAGGVLQGLRWAIDASATGPEERDHQEGSGVRFRNWGVGDVDIEK